LSAYRLFYSPSPPVIPLILLWEPAGELVQAWEAAGAALDRTDGSNPLTGLVHAEENLFCTPWRLCLTIYEGSYSSTASVNINSLRIYALRIIGGGQLVQDHEPGTATRSIGNRTNVPTETERVEENYLGAARKLLSILLPQTLAGGSGFP